MYLNMSSDNKDYAEMQDLSMKGSDVVELLPEEFTPWREKAKEQRSFLRKSFKKE